MDNIACRLVSNYQLNAQFLYSITIYTLHYNPRHVSSSTILIFRRSDCIITASGIVTLCKRPYSTPVESGLTGGWKYWLVVKLVWGMQGVYTPRMPHDTRCCNNTIWPPEGEDSTAQNMSRIIMLRIYCYRIKELCIKLVIWNKSVLWCMVRKTSEHFLCPFCSSECHSHCIFK